MRVIQIVDKVIVKVIDYVVRRPAKMPDVIDYKRWGCICIQEGTRHTSCLIVIISVHKLLSRSLSAFGQSV